MAQAQQTRMLSNLTADDLESLPADIGRFELIEGEIVPLTPANFRHGRVAFKFGFVLGLFNMQHKLGVFLTAETGFFTRKNRKTVRAPDLAFISYRRLPLVWVVYPESQRIHVFTSTKSAQIFNADDTITGGEVFPAFEAPVRAFFED